MGYLPLNVPRFYTPRVPHRKTTPMVRNPCAELTSCMASQPPLRCPRPCVPAPGAASPAAPTLPVSRGLQKLYIRVCWTTRWRRACPDDDRPACSAACPPYISAS
ncbi:hypothetical protein VFPBJ_10384 [Purpureocillium lilacinum]|uniref:Uncharacterized protein n=1 Tax=Purpureocillium lilacinum TaxID=33203 RepID=A0A179G124_PURLI|nr:hypothetical protein VFPBJ_10384 [Purpureocillium lilacinum]